MSKWFTGKLLEGHVQLAISEMKIIYHSLKFSDTKKILLGDKNISTCRPVSVDSLYTLQGAKECLSKAFGLIFSLGALANSVNPFPWSQDCHVAPVDFTCHWEPLRGKGLATCMNIHSKLCHFRCLFPLILKCLHVFGILTGQTTHYTIQFTSQ